MFLKGSRVFSGKHFQNLTAEPKRECRNASQYFAITHQFHYFTLYF